MKTCSQEKQLEFKEQERRASIHSLNGMLSLCVQAAITKYCTLFFKQQTFISHTPGGKEAGYGLPSKALLSDP